MSDLFEHHVPGFDAPASGAFAIVPDDTTILQTTTRAIYVGTGGTLRVEMKAGGQISFDNLPDGALLPIRAVKVVAATTASGLVGLY